MSSSTTIRLIESSEISELVDYLVDHVRDNGADGTALFLPLASDATWPKAEKLKEFKLASETSLEEPNWRRFWVARDARHAILGHVDLRARRESNAAHRTVLGMGVHRDHRGMGLGRKLLQFALEWAHEQAGLEWVDLEVIATNEPARTLYQHSGFHDVAIFRDMFRIDGASIDYAHMTKALREKQT